MFSGLRIFSSTVTGLGRKRLNVFWDANPFSSPEPVVSWSRGRLQIKPSGSGDENGC